MKKITIIVFIILVLTFGVVVANANTVTSGTCGNDVSWTFDSASGKLTFSGSGELNSKLWKTDFQYDVKEVVINEGITSIASYTFSGCENIQKINFPATLTKIGDGIFNKF